MDAKRKDRIVELANLVRSLDDRLSMAYRQLGLLYRTYDGAEDLILCTLHGCQCDCGCHGGKCTNHVYCEMDSGMLLCEECMSCGGTDAEFANCTEE